MHRLCLILIFIAAFNGVAQEMRIGILRSVKSKSVSLTSFTGTYGVYGDSTFLGRLDENQVALANISGAKVQLSLNGISKGLFEKILFAQDSSGSVMQVISTSPKSKTHQYQDNFEISSEQKRLRIVNMVDMLNYLSGVIESEGGGGRHLEYYKVQALMSRTYAFQNINRHQKEGFALCDNVHCQAYHNMLKRTPTIRTAVEETNGEVIVDNHNKMLTTYFSANCGGQTCDASHVWNNSVNYCESILDTFCVTTKQALWTKSIGRSAWLNYLDKEYGFETENKELLEYAFNFKQNQRKAFYIHPSLWIPLRDLRSKFKLKSTYFDVSLEGDKVRLDGHGFGHGVGLCQEGAMNMAKAGYSYRQIAKFYFSGVSIVNYKRQLFFGQTSSEM